MRSSFLNAMPFPSDAHLEALDELLERLPWPAAMRVREYFWLGPVFKW